MPKSNPDNSIFLGGKKGKRKRNCTGKKKATSLSNKNWKIKFCRLLKSHNQHISGATLQIKFLYSR